MKLNKLYFLFVLGLIGAAYGFSKVEAISSVHVVSCGEDDDDPDDDGDDRSDSMSAQIFG